MGTLGLVLLAFAFVCAVLAAIGVPAGRYHLGWAAVALWIAAELFGGLIK